MAGKALALFVLGTLLTVGLASSSASEDLDFSRPGGGHVRFIGRSTKFEVQTAVNSSIRVSFGLIEELTADGARVNNHKITELASVKPVFEQGEKVQLHSGGSDACASLSAVVVPFVVLDTFEYIESCLMAVFVSEGIVQTTASVAMPMSSAHLECSQLQRVLCCRFRVLRQRTERDLRQVALASQ